MSVVRKRNASGRTLDNNDGHVVCLRTFVRKLFCRVDEMMNKFFSGIGPMIVKDGSNPFFAERFISVVERLRNTV